MTVYTVVSIEKLPAFIYTLNVLEGTNRWSYDVSLMYSDKRDKIIIMYYEPNLISYWNPLLGMSKYDKEVSISEYILLQCF